MSRTLDVYLHNKYAGKLIQNDAGALSLSYDEDYVKEVDLSRFSSAPCSHLSSFSFESHGTFPS